MKIIVRSDRVFPSLKIAAKSGDVVNTHPEVAAIIEVPEVLPEENVVVSKKSKKVEVNSDGTPKE